VFPDYGRSIVNLVGSVEAAFGLRPLHDPLDALEPESLRGRSVVALLVMDGLGAELLDAHAASAPFLQAHRHSVISSVYPSTTAAAVTSLLSGMTPLEHGALGWSLYLKELGRYVDFLPFRDSVSGALLGRRESGMERILSIKNVFERLAGAGAETFYIAPRFIVTDQFADESSEPARRLGYRSLEGMFRLLARVARGRARRSGALKRYVFCYAVEPDHTVHRNGTAGAKTASVIRRLDGLLERASRRLAGTGTTILVTADHGLVDTPVHLWLDEDPEAYRSLVMPPFPEKRFLSFHVKAHRRAAFPELMRRYGGEFLLLSREELLERGFLGRGNPHPKVDDFLGDFAALATGTSQMHTRIAGAGREEKRFVAHHAGLRRGEMLVPLVRIDA